MGVWQRIKTSKGGIAVLAIGSLCTLAYIPVWYHVNFVPKHDMSKPLPRSAAMRGAYVNTGSRDIGPDRPIDHPEHQDK